MNDLPTNLPNSLTFHLFLANATQVTNGKIEFLYYLLDGKVRVYIPTLGWYGPDTQNNIINNITRDIATKTNTEPPARTAPDRTSPGCGNLGGLVNH